MGAQGQRFSKQGKAPRCGEQLSEGRELVLGVPLGGRWRATAGRTDCTGQGLAAGRHPGDPHERDMGIQLGQVLLPEQAGVHPGLGPQLSTSLSALCRRPPAALQGEAGTHNLPHGLRWHAGVAVHQGLGGLREGVGDAVAETLAQARPVEGDAIPGWCHGMGGGPVPQSTAYFSSPLHSPPSSSSSPDPSRAPGSHLF